MRKTLTLATCSAVLLFASTAFTQQPVPPLAPVAASYPQAVQTLPRPLPPTPSAYYPAPTLMPMPAAMPMPTAMPVAVMRPSSSVAVPLTTKVIDIADVILQPGTSGSRAAVENRADRLKDLLESFVAPETWTDAGGKGSMVYFATNHTLVVNNEAKVAKEVETWIDRMRTASKPKVTVSIHQVRCAPGALAKLGYGTKAKEAVVLTPTQRTAAMKALEADPRFELLTSPSMLLLDNQTGFFQVGQHILPNAIQDCPTVAPFVGSTIRSTPRLSPDGKTIQVRIESECSHLAPAKPTPDLFMKAQTVEGYTALVRVEPKPAEAPRVKSQSVTTTFTVPQGGTALVPMGTQTMTERTEWKVPVLGDVPVVDCLFRGSCSEEKDCELFMLVTASSLTGPNAEPPVVMSQPTLSTACELVTNYRKACIEGRTEDARKFATMALGLDPKCFETK